MCIYIYIKRIRQMKLYKGLGLSDKLFSYFNFLVVMKIIVDNLGVLFLTKTKRVSSIFAIFWRKFHSEEAEPINLK